jgi:RND family efflux transporter MFP subunit
MTTKYIPLVFTVILAACSSQSADDVAGKKAELEKARKELSDVRAKVVALEKEIAVLDPSFAPNNAILVAPVKITKTTFEHLVDVRGAVESRRNVTMSAQMGGKIVRVHVREGEKVGKGQTLVSLDTDILYSTIAELKTQLQLAKTVFEKQEKLWSQKIGTEIQYLKAKNDKEALESKLVTTNAQLDQLIIRAPYSGTVDRVEGLEGEIASPGMPLVRMVNQDDLYIRADVSENFIGKFSTGDKVEVYLPAQDKTLQSTLKSIGQVINPENRTFDLEVKLPSGLNVKPNQIAIVKLSDYKNTQAFVVATRFIQRDNQGQFVYALSKNENKKDVASKVYVRTGVSYDGKTEILEGLKEGDTIIGEGFRDVAEGVEVNIAKEEEAKKEVTAN